MGSGISRHSGGDVALGVSGDPGSSPRRMASSYRVGEVPCSSPVASKSEASTISFPLRYRKGTMLLWSSLSELHRILVSAPDLSAQACSPGAKARVFSCITVQKF